MSELPLAALVLAGGYGTRLRPLTFTRSKSLVEFCNQPMVQFMIDALIKVNCKKIIFALSELQHDFADYIKEQQKIRDVEIIASLEKVAMGTAGPIALARKHLENSRFFVLNSDIISPYPFGELLKVHKEKGGIGTIMSWKVDDPSRFGVILSNENGLITSFVEKPQDFVGDAINAGHYIFEPSILDYIPNKPTSIERETFPSLVSEGKLYVTPLDGFWADIGTPSSLIAAIPMLLSDNNGLLIGHTCEIGEGTKFIKNVVIGNGVKIGKRCLFENCVVMDESVVGDDVVIENSIVGWRNVIGNGVCLTQLCVFGESVTVNNDIKLDATMVCPYKVVADIPKPKKIII